MFDISALKELKLSELQEIAKTAKTIKFNGVKKETLISQILEHQAAAVATTVEKASEVSVEEDKPKRARIAPVKKVAPQKNVAPYWYVNEEDKEDKKEDQEVAVVPEKKEKAISPIANEAKENIVPQKKEGKVVKFSKSAYEKKLALQKEKEALKEAAIIEETPSNTNLEVVAETTEAIENPTPAKKINPQTFQPFRKVFGFIYCTHN